jgi:TRAP-type mannitol/chloroaromatic compound transport system substrate-binding protein
MFYKMKWKLIAAMCILLFVVTFIPTTPDDSYAQGKVYEWRMPSFLPRGTAAEKVREQWCKDVAVATGGRIKIAYYGAGEILPPLQMWDGLNSGAIDIAMSYGAYWRGKSPLSLFSEGFPFVFDDVGQFYALLYEYGLEDIIRKSYAKRGIHLLRVLPVLQNTLISINNFDSIDELKKRKVRAGGPPAEVFKAMGIAPIYIPTPDIYGALQRKVIDVNVGGPISYFYDLGFHEIGKYVLVPGLGIEADEIIMSKKTWDSLPKDLQMILYHSAGELSQKTCANYYGRDSKTLDTMKTKFKVKTITLSNAEMRRMSEYTMKAIENVAKTEKDPEFDEAAKVLHKFLKDQGRL